MLIQNLILISGKTGWKTVAFHSKLYREQWEPDFAESFPSPCFGCQAMVRISNAITL